MIRWLLWISLNKQNQKTAGNVLFKIKTKKHYPTSNTTSLATVKQLLALRIKLDLSSENVRIGCHKNQKLCLVNVQSTYSKMFSSKVHIS